MPRKYRKKPFEPRVVSRFEVEDVGTAHDLALGRVWSVVVLLDFAKKEFEQYHATASANRGFDWRAVNAMRRLARSVYDQTKAALKLAADLHGVGDGIGRPQRLLDAEQVMEEIARLKGDESFMAGKVTPLEQVAQDNNVSVRTVQRTIAKWRKDHPEQVRKVDRPASRGRRVHHFKKKD